MPEESSLAHTQSFGESPASQTAGAGLIGQILNGAYRVDQRIGAGGMGVVYKATQIALGRPVALKTILQPDRAEDAIVQRFLREAEALSALNHPNIVNIIDFGRAEPGPIYYIVMEYLRGEALDVFVSTRGPLPVETILELMGQICSGVEAAHRSQMIHRDLKPNNIHLCNVTGGFKPVVKILDFGLAKMVAGGNLKPITQAGFMVGTLGFTAPEQLKGEPGTDLRADVYSLGAVLYYMLTAQLPFIGESFQAVLAKQLTEPPAPIDHQSLRLPQSRAIEGVIHKAMSREAAKRHASASEFFEDLTAACAVHDTQTDRYVRTVVSPSTGGAAVRKSPLARWALGGVAGLLAIAAIVWAVIAWNRPEPAPDIVAGPGITATEIRIGMVGPFSGANKELGRGMKVGIEAAFQEANAAGGIQGRKLRLIPLDDGYEPERSKKQVAKLLGMPVFAFLGNVGTPTNEASLPSILEEQRLLFGPYTGAALVRRDPPDRYVFNFRAGYAEETAAVVHHLVDVKRVRPEEVAVFAQNDSFGEDGFTGVARALRKHGHEQEKILRTGYKRNTLDVGEAVAAIEKASPKIKAVVMVATYSAAAAFIKEARDRNIDAIFTNISFVGSMAFAEKLSLFGPKYAEGVIVTQVVPDPNSKSSGVLRYREMMREYFPTEGTGYISLEGYISGSIFVEGLRLAGTQLTTESVVAALERIHEMDLGIGISVTYGPSRHQASRKVWASILDRDGNYHPFDLD